MTEVRDLGSAADSDEFHGGPTFVMGGGGNLGALQVGMLAAFAEYGVVPARIVGTSVGAINGALFSGRAHRDGVEQIAQLWRSLRRRTILRLHPTTFARGVVGASDYLFDSLALREVIASQLNFNRLEEAPIPLTVVATDFATGSPVLIERGDAVTALLASSAVPRLLPPVDLDGQLLIDGAGSADLPIREAITLGARDLYVLPTAPVQVERALAAVRASGLVQDHPLTVHIVPPPGVRVPYGALDQAERLMLLGYEQAQAAIAQDPFVIDGDASVPLSTAVVGRAHGNARRRRERSATGCGRVRPVGGLRR